MISVMEKRQADRKAILFGDVIIYLKEDKYFLNGKWEKCVFKHFDAHRVAIIEIDGICYASMP